LIGNKMREYEARSATRVSGSGEYPTQAQAVAPARTGEGEIEQRSRTGSLLQLREAFDQSPAVRSQVALQRALDLSKVEPAGSLQGRQKPLLQSKGIALRIAPPARISNAAVQRAASPGGNELKEDKPEREWKHQNAQEDHKAREIEDDLHADNIEWNDIPISYVSGGPPLENQEFWRGVVNREIVDRSSEWDTGVQSFVFADGEMKFAASVEYSETQERPPSARVISCSAGTRSQPIPEPQWTEPAVELPPQEDLPPIRAEIPEQQQAPRRRIRSDSD
jgi:hypothetical protein